MSERVTLEYLRWLSPQVHPEGAPRHQQLLRLMHAKGFVFIDARDNSRTQDARDLRDLCMDEIGLNMDSLSPVSVLEVLVGLSKRLAFATGGAPEHWAWQLVVNLGLHRYSGHLGAARAQQIDFILDRLIWRQYEPDGVGGFFPLAQPEEDQRNMELWYQLHAYLQEQEE